MKTTARSLFNVQNQLGEGPLWHPAEKCLYWVDIATGELFKSNSSLTGYEAFHFDTMIGAYGFRKDGGFILATKNGFSLWDKGLTDPEVLWNPLPKRDDVRMNDGKVDPGGRFWAGSMDADRREGGLYRLDPDGSQHCILDHIGISNGIGWSPDRKTMYYTDSIQSTIFAFDYEVETGIITNQRPFIQLPEDGHGIVPDGLCVDVDGCIWSAHWNGWEVLRYDPQGKPMLKVEVPAQQVTSCCFGGENMDLLIITSARIDLPIESLDKQPLAGNLFVFETDTRGQPAHYFGETTHYHQERS